MIRFETIIEKLRKNHPDADEELLRRAYLFSARQHRGQTRQSGEPYLVHPLEVANILVDLNLDPICVATGLLHDIVEDTETSAEEIEEYFGPEIAHLVDGLTKISKLDHASTEERQALNMRKMLLAMVDDVRVVLVKLADRLHNMRTLEYLPGEKRRRIAQETLDVYAPIAHRLGMARVRGELEDLAFKHLEPEEYQKLKELVESRRSRLEAFLEEVKQRILDMMGASGIQIVYIEGRIKRLFSIYQKLRRQQITIDQVYDLVAIRIITESVRDCYAALGVIHTAWKPIPGRFKDWIAIPRENFYQSLHTSVVGEGGQSFEVQIRTREMQSIAEEGIAAHWKYKEGRRGTHTDEDEAFVWLKRLVEWQQEVKDSREFLDSLKLDLYPKEVYCFTPKGKVIELPRGATPVDFAFMIHTQVGLTCNGAKVNSRIVPLKYQLRNGDVVEIMTTPSAHPSRDWMNFAKTSRARAKIRHYLAESERSTAVELGKKLFEKEADRFRLNTKKILSNGDFDRIAADYGVARAEDLLAAIGYGKVLPRNVIAKLLPPDRVGEIEQDKRPTLKQVVKRALGMQDRIVVKGIDDVMVYRARCCNPIRGEDIIGYITRGKGVAVHSNRCPNMPGLLVNPERLIDVEWMKADAKHESAYPVTMKLVTEDRPGMVADVTQAIAGVGTNIRDIRASLDDDGRGQLVLTAEIFDLKHLERIIGALKSVRGVMDVERSTGEPVQVS
ncbi:MAG TPA: bifunctional (p)ppGpp synthetase/guanosine-3',5'-bis(diphosphate) 3'-pyrophosphohydrolase [Blastocatellia bacterium]|nr:bifunctional (p)ppGpp synthetase/guanosine-3',5'-bis(diphosphate) 3'-pyrophosphohydrolase [Blastocatellia bacterium]